MLRVLNGSGVAVAAAAMAAIILACSPTDTCGCTYPPPQAIVYGEVTDPAGAPVSGAEVLVQLADPGCTQPTRVLGTGTTAAAGRYRIQAHVAPPPNVGECLRAVANPPHTSELASSNPVPFTVAFRLSPLDSVRVDLQLRKP